MKRRVLTLLTIIILGGGGLYFFINFARSDRGGEGVKTSPEEVSAITENLPPAKTIIGLTHVGQTFNNCSSVALVIAFSHWDIKDTQEAVALATRPWNNPRGDNDDKSVTLYEMAEYAQTKGLATYVRPNGTIDLLKKFVANDIPIIARALNDPNKDYVHYRVVKGYNESRKVIIESDGIEGPNETYTYDQWLYLWKDYNYSYLVVVPPEKRGVVEAILGKEKDEQVAWQNAKARAEAELAKNPNNYFAHFNLVTALYYLGDYKGTVREFEKIETHLTEHKLWYQMEPIEAYFNLGNYDRVIALADSVINNNNKSVSELYILKGKIYQKRGEVARAREEFEKAIYYNKSLKAAREALASLE